MNWVTTNIRFPEHLYAELKAEAVKRRISLAEVIRQRVSDKKKRSPKEVARFMRDLDKLAEENARQNPGISFSDKLIEMRYEQ